MLQLRNSSVLMLLYLSILLHLYIYIYIYIYISYQNIQYLMQLKIFSLFLFYHDMWDEWGDTQEEQLGMFK
jgi:hypothetical protein